MNKQRRKALERAMGMISDARAIIEEMRDEEQECYDNLPEGIQMSEKGEAIEENAYRLSEIVDILEEQENELDEIICG